MGCAPSARVLTMVNAGSSWPSPAGLLGGISWVGSELLTQACRITPLKAGSIAAAPSVPRQAGRGPWAQPVKGRNFRKKMEPQRRER